MHTILVLEDSVVEQAIIRKEFTDRGHVVLMARSVVQALEFLLKITEIDAVWVDHLVLGNRDGINLVTLIKQDRRFATLPVYLISGVVSDKDVAAYEELGISRCFLKSEHQIKDVVAAVCEDLI